MIRGSCLCGGVRFEVDAPFRRVNVCHCSRCRKHSGAHGLVQGRVARERFRLVAGEELLRAWRPRGGGKAKVFCSECGSSLFGGDWPGGDEVSVRFGALDGDPGIRPQYHSFVASRAPWDVLPDDGLPRHDGANPDAQRAGLRHVACPGIPGSDPCCSRHVPKYQGLTPVVRARLRGGYGAPTADAWSPTHAPSRPR